MSHRICVCCGEVIPEAETQGSSDPNLCAACVGMGEDYTRRWQRRDAEAGTGGQSTPEEPPDAT
jgi:hypothetical protein